MGLKKVIYRIVQEQINNIIKHANASKAVVEIKVDLSGLELIIDDNGNGFNMSSIKKGIGLKNIESRADIYNGDLKIISSPGKGCILKVFFKT